MTSFTRALYRRDPAAAKAFYRDSKRDQFESAFKVPPTVPTVGFGRRTPQGVVGCAVRCTHPACSQGCTLAGRK